MILYLLAVGRVRHPALRDACEDYLARVRRYFRLELVELPDSGKGGRGPTAALKREGSALLRALPDGARIIGLTRGGDSLDSSQFARQLAAHQTASRKLTFLIGGAFGLAQPVLDRCHEFLSISAFTLPHELARLVLLEQLYRAGTILQGEPYHKGQS